MVGATSTTDLHLSASNLGPEGVRKLQKRLGKALLLI